MPVVAEVEEWLRKMGYTGEISSNLSKICNPSTTFIWEQLMCNIRSRDEVKYIRNNIIVNRLTQKSLDQQDDFNYPCREVDIYRKKLELNSKIEHTERKVEEKGDSLNDVLNRNKNTYVLIDKIKAKIKENKEKKYLITKKSQMVQIDVQTAQEVLALARNLTPVEMDFDGNKHEVTQTLQKCAEKLQKIVESESIHETCTKKFMPSTQKPKITISQVDTFSTYLEQSLLNEIAPSCKKVTYSRKETHSNHSNVNRCLTFENNVCTNSKMPKRESLGLLDEDCFNISDEFEFFLTSPKKCDNSHMPSLPESLLESSNKYGILEKLYNNDSVKKLLRKLLYENNRNLILSQCKSIYEDLVMKISQSLMECNKASNTTKSVSEEDLCKLYSIHLNTELEKVDHEHTLKSLKYSIKIKKEQLGQFYNKTKHVDELKNILDIQITKAYLQGANYFLRKKFDSFKEMGSENEVQVLSHKINQVQDEILSKTESIQTLIRDTSQVILDVKRNRQATSGCVRKLIPFIQDLSWAQKMTEDTNSKEIEAFKRFPLEWNREAQSICGKVFYRDVSETTVPSYIKLDSDELKIITSLMDSPFTFPENLVLEKLERKQDCKKYKSGETPFESFSEDYHIYTSQELKKGEAFVETAINKLSKVINAQSETNLPSSSCSMQKVVDLHIEMPFTKAISERREVDGFGYKHYEKVFDNLCSS